MPRSFDYEVDPRTQCWLITSHETNANGYISVKRITGQHYAHRLAYSIAYGEIPKGKRVFHECGNKRCINPDHLYVK